MRGRPGQECYDGILEVNAVPASFCQCISRLYAGVWMRMRQRLVETGIKHAYFASFAVCMTLQVMRMQGQGQLTGDQDNCQYHGE